jgi:UMF1 family MFS transporter
MGFTTNDNIILILVVNITAAIGAFVFGLVEDRIGSKNTLIVTLLIWSAATTMAFFVEQRFWFWAVANLVGIAMGSSQSAGRAIVGLFSPPQRSGEFFGLWGLATKLAAIIGPVSYGIITHLTHGQHRLALLSTTLFFVAGLLLLTTVNEKRGREAAYAATVADSNV